ncbi:MAG TPA: EAL domain-containing protein [Candidatus Limnocylindrales bacterium]
MTENALRLQPLRRDGEALTDSPRYLVWLRLAIAATTLMFAAAGSTSGVVPSGVLAAVAFGYAALALVAEWSARRADQRGMASTIAMVLVDGAFLALATYATGGAASSLRFLVYLQLIAVSLLVSYRAGLLIAAWDTVLLVGMVQAQVSGIIPAVDLAGGQNAVQVAAVGVSALWVFALATSLFLALTERELRQRRADLEALVPMGTRLADEGDPIRQASIVLDGLVDRFGFSRGLVLGIGDDGLVVLGSHAVAVETRQSLRVDPVVERAWSTGVPLALPRLDRASAPTLVPLLPGARRVIVAPLLADDRPMGVIVLERRNGRQSGAESRLLGVVERVAAMTALNLRNAVLLRRVQDPEERDALTGAANRRTFQASLQRALWTSGRRGARTSSVLFVDLDDFKTVNDTHGFETGDALLVAVTRRIESLIRDGDILARLGGDEFAILTDDMPDLRRSRVMADRLVRELRLPFMLGETTISISASIGIAGAADDADSAADLVRNADVAMYVVKAGGKAGFAVFDPSMPSEIRGRHELATELQQAVDLDQLELRYQPIVNLQTGAMVGFEALVRWRHPDRGLIVPGQFIEIAEEHGSILPIGRWVLREACRQVAAWTADGSTAPGMYVSVNVSAREVQQDDFVEGVRDALTDHGVDASSLVIEVTETALLRATQATITALTALNELGVRVVIDNFGSGYFSLGHLRRFPVHALKIAQEFTQDIDDVEDARSSGLAAAVVAMARSLGIETVAEAIETEAQANWMRSLGCTYAQGFYFDRPMLAEELPAVARPTVVSLAEEAAEAEAAAEITRARTRRRRAVEPHAAKPAKPNPGPESVTEIGRARRRSRASGGQATRVKGAA